MKSRKPPLERVRERLAGVDEHGGWFFAAIARLEAGGRPPRIDTLLRIADALDCDLHVELRPRH